MSFETNPLNDDLISLSNTSAIARSIRNIVFTSPNQMAGLGTAFGTVSITDDGGVNQVYITDAGYGYTSFTSKATITAPPVIAGVGTYNFNEIVTGSISGATGRVKSWDVGNNILKLGATNGTFVTGDVAVGSDSEANYSIDYIESAEFADKYDKGDEIEKEADSILDFSESNPFGDY